MHLSPTSKLGYLSFKEPKITPFPNGILVTGQTPVDVIQQHWTIVITLEPPEMLSNFSRSVNLVRQALIRSAKGSCPYYLAPSRGGVEARAGPHNGDTENPIMSTPHPYLVTGSRCV